MPPSIDDQVIDFYQNLFERIFSEPFREQIAERRKRNTVVRQIEEVADAASQSLTRFFRNQRLGAQETADILDGFSTIGDQLQLADIANPNVTPEGIADRLLEGLAIPDSVQEAEHETVFRLGLHAVVQVLLLVGPVAVEWQKLNFSRTFELPRRIVSRLNQISQQLDALGQAGQAAADELFELSYRDYLLQRFHRIEAGTVRMTTNVTVDLRELFVMSRLHRRPVVRRSTAASTGPTSAARLPGGKILTGCPSGSPPGQTSWSPGCSWGKPP